MFRRKPQVSGLVGVSITPDRLSIARVERNGKEGPKLALLDSMHCGQDTDQAETLVELVKEHRLSNAPCVAVLAPDSYSLLQVESPDVAPDELRAALRWRIKDLIDFHLDDAVIDAFDIPGHIQAGRPQSMYVVAAKNSVVQQQVDLIEESGMQLAAIDVTELALRNVMAHLPEDVGGCALLLFTESRGFVLLCRQSTIYLARNLETSLGQMLSLDAQADADTTLMDNLILELQRSLDYYESFFSQPPVKGLIISAAGNELPGFIAHAGSTLGIQTRMLDINDILQPEAPFDGTAQAEGLLAIGAALRQEVRQA